jgi:1,4-alpha-glucan branching enzyme
MWSFDGETLGAGGIYFFTDWRALTPWGNTRPDYGRPQVRDFIVDSVRAWLDEYRMDGARWDATFEIRAASGTPLPEGLAVLQAASAMTHSRAGPKIAIAEDFRGSDLITSDGGFDTQWDSDFFHPVVDAVVTSDDGARSMSAVAAAVTHLFDDEAVRRVIYTESHDEVANGRQRVPEMIWPGNAASLPSRKRSTLAAALALTSPGIPMIFQGQEFLEDGYFTAARALDWTKEQRFAGIQLLYRDLIRLRRDWQGNTAGLRGDGVNVFHVDEGQKLLAYHRWDKGGRGDDVVIVANFSQNTFPIYRIGFPRGGAWHVRLNSDARTYGDDFGAVPVLDTTAVREQRDGLGWAGDLSIGPYSAVILSQ